MAHVLLTYLNATPCAGGYTNKIMIEWWWCVGDDDDMIMKEDNIREC